MVYPKVSDPWIDSDLFAMINMMFFSFTFGWGLSANSVLGPLKVDQIQKPTAGFIITYALSTGLLSGTLMSNLFKLIWKQYLRYLDTLILYIS